MSGRTGEKVGFTAGWMRGFRWVLILSTFFIVQDKCYYGSLGLGLVVIAVINIVYFSPWRFTSTPYWRLMIAPYMMFLFW